MHAPLPIALARRAPLAHRKQARLVTRQRKKYLSPARFHRASQHPGQDPATIQTQQKGATVCACIARPPLRTVGSSCKARTCRKAPLAHATNDFQLLVAAGRPRVRYLSKRGAPDMLQLTDTPGPTGMEVTRPRLVHSGAPSHSKKTLPPWAWRPPPTAGARRAMALAPAARKQSPGRPGRRAAPPRSPLRHPGVAPVAVRAAAAAAAVGIPRAKASGRLPAVARWVRVAGRRQQDSGGAARH